MVIKSPFKDYYDFVANRYGGGDPKIVYVRNRPKRIGVWVERCPLNDPNRYLDTTKHFLLAYLIVCGRGYVLRYDKAAWPLVEAEKINRYHLLPPDWTIPEERQPRYRWFRSRTRLDLWGFVPGEENKFLIDLSLKVGEPVFAIVKIERGEDVMLSPHCPNLGQIGLSSLISPEQMYQNLAMFVGNTMRVPPDTAPPVEVSNREKILKAGFDLRQSFRHRKNI